MVKLLIVADDFTGALDTGVQFAHCGAVTRVVTDPQIDYRQLLQEVQVLVLDAETRHLSAEQAKAVVKSAVCAARGAGVEYVYKKIDSALRGNVGAELEGMYEAMGGKSIHFIPAFPQMGRTTQNGIHYIDGVPVSESVFGKDPFEPVRNSAVDRIIAQQSSLPVRLMGEHCPTHGTLPNGVLVYDGVNERQVRRTAQNIVGRGEPFCGAGCAGFAAALPELLGLTGAAPRMPILTSRLLVACGSVNPITLRQLDQAERAGIARVRLTPKQKLDAGWIFTQQAETQIKAWRELCEKKGVCLLDSNDLPGRQDTLDYAAAHGMTLEQLRQTISGRIGQIVQRLLDGGLEATVMLTGGDTLLGFMSDMKIDQLVPICELAPGTVLSAFTHQNKTYHIISKSGGFGAEDLMSSLANQIVSQQEETNAESV